MSKRIRFFVLLLGILLPLLGVEITKARHAGDAGALIPQGNPADASGQTIPRERLAPLVCPMLGGYASSLEQPNYCVYYNDPPTTNAEATLVEGYVDDYWDRYSVDYGFNAPDFTPPKLEVRIENNATCNGSAWDNNVKLWDGCFDPANPEFMQYVTGHEIFHRVQFAHDPDWAATWSNSGWIYEGTARNMEDVAFANVDTWANCLAVPFSYCDEVNDYLGFTNADITSFGMRYESNLFWTFFREQFGTTVTEPQRGVDALLELWDQMCCAESVSAVNNALAVLSPGTTFDAAFRQFTVANYTKDLTALPDDSYNYADEDQAGNPAPYGPLVPASGGTISSGSPASWAGQNVSRYGARYYVAAPHATNCPVITASFQRTAGSTEFYHVVTQNGSAFNTHVEGSGASWTQSFLNDGVTQIAAIIGGQSNSATVDVELSCADPMIDIELPNTLAPAYVGPAASPDDIVVQVSVTDGSPTGPVVGGLTNSDFKVEVGGIPALVTGGGFVQEEYFLLVNTPTQSSNGPYDLEVFLEEPGTTTVIASDMESEAVIYDNTDTDHIIVTDVSGSMGWDGKMEAAKNAANLFIDASNSTEGLGLVSYNHDVVSTLGVEFASLPHRNDAHNEVNAYFASGATSIGDGLDEAVNLLGASPTGNARCQFTLLSDGIENSALFWTDVQAAVQATDCPVMTIAFGQASSELLMQDIATATGGAAYYNDVFVSAANAPTDEAETELSLGDTYLHALCEAQGCERLLSVEDEVDDYLQVMTYTLTVDDSINELIAVLDWWSGFQTPVAPQQSDFVLYLFAPDDTTYGPQDYAFESEAAGHAGYRIDTPATGDWVAAVVYVNEIPNRKFRLLVSGQTDTAVQLLLPAIQANGTGDYIPLYAIWMPGGTISATVTAPDGAPTVVPMYDDGQHGDGAAGDGFFGGLYTLVTQANAVEPVREPGVDDPPEPQDEGAYRVHLIATYREMRRETLGSFAVPEGDDEDNDGVPDSFVQQHCPGAPNSDADLDRLSCSDEYFTGTDPNNSDTDGDGESDHSEAILHGLDPLNAGDDMIEAPEFVQTAAQNGSVLLTYDVKAEYDSMLTYRATSVEGPWNLVTSELPLTGVYTDTTVVNDTTYYYCAQAIDGENHWSAVVCSEAVEPRIDPVPPEAGVLINGGADSTGSRDVVLTFVASDEEHETGLYAGQSAFDDIDEMLISNDPSMAGATWQPFAQGVSWQLERGIGFRTVYVRFRDVNDNESVGTETATIFLDQTDLFLPIILNR